MSVVLLKALIRLIIGVSALSMLALAHADAVDDIFPIFDEFFDSVVILSFIVFILLFMSEPYYRFKTPKREFVNLKLTKEKLICRICVSLVNLIFLGFSFRFVDEIFSQRFIIFSLSAFVAAHILFIFDEFYWIKTAKQNRLER